MIMVRLSYLISIFILSNCANSAYREPDITPPSAPSNLSASIVTSNAITLTWEPSIDEQGVAAYHILRDGVEIAKVGNILSYENKNLNPSTSYGYSARASDYAGNLSIESNGITITTREDLNEFFSLDLPDGIDTRDLFNWNESEKIFTFLKSVHFSTFDNPDEDLEGFYWKVPNKVSRIVIASQVQIVGGFRFTGSQTIEGADRSSSVIYGTITKNWSLGPDGVKDQSTTCASGAQGDDYVHDCEKWKYSAVSVVPEAPEDIVVEVKNLTVENARAYAITAQKHRIVIDNVHILNSRPKPDYHSNSDGFGAGTGSIIRNSKIDTWDDAIKLYRNMTVENVTIIHNSNGAPFQLGWGDGNPTSEHTLKNVLVIPDNQQHSNLALFSASLTEGSINRKISIEGIKAIYGSEQEIRTSDPLPLFWLKSPGATVEIIAPEESNVHLFAPFGLLGPGILQSILCGDNLIKNNYLCGDPGQVTGCGW